MVHMKSAKRACLLLLGLTTVASISSARAASAQRGDLIYVQSDRDFGASKLLVRSPSGVHRGSLHLTLPDDTTTFNTMAISNDGKLAFLTTDRVFSDLKFDLWVVAIRSGTPKVLSKHVLAPFKTSTRADCTIDIQAAIAAGLPAGGKYPLFVAMGFSCGYCDRKPIATLFQSTWVLNLSYDVHTRKLAQPGATRTSYITGKHNVCNATSNPRVLALYVPRLPGGRNGVPLMAFGEHDGLTFWFRGIKPGSPNLLSWRTAHLDIDYNIIIGGPVEVYSSSSNTISQIKRTSNGQRMVTKLGHAPSSFTYWGQMATLQGAKQPIYVVASTEFSGDKIFKHNKADRGAIGKALRGVTDDEILVSLIAVVP